MKQKNRTTNTSMCCVGHPLGEARCQHHLRSCGPGLLVFAFGSIAETFSISHGVQI